MQALEMEKGEVRAGEPTLLVVYQTDKPVSRDAVEEALQALTRSFEAYANERGPQSQGATLEIHRLEFGSIIAELIAVAGALDTIYDHRELLAGFVTHIQGVVQAVLGIGAARVKAVDRRLFPDLARPVADQRAININISVAGSHNSIIVDRQLVERAQAQPAAG